MNPLAYKALRLMSDQEFRSGELISRELGVSRAGLSQSLKELAPLGVEVFKVHGRGYRLAQPLDWLEPARVETVLGDRARLFAIEYFDQVESTNTLLLEKAASSANSGACVVAELQTKGRGRRGRGWFAPLAGALTFSLLWRFSQGAALLSTLSLVAGIAVIRALKQLGIDAVALKWPNDIVHHDRKLGGILIELQGDALGPAVAVIGVGLNFRLDERTLTRIDQAATDFASITDEVPSRSTALGLVLGAFADVLPQFEARGFAAFRDEWLAYHAYHNKPVRVRLPDATSHDGIVTGIAEDGSLVVSSDGAARRYTAAEISLRAA
jgi:BirA family transcriptional regulator, biotin operon repressor / biotin---[acetyl-CoA-carboxylase] ligase